MRAGKLRRRASLQRKQVSQDEFGAEVTTWREIARLWAAIRPLQGREFWTSQAEQGEITTRIEIRYRGDVRVADRLVWSGKTFDIEAVTADERLTSMELMCKELVA